MAERKTIYLDDAMDAIRKDMYADRDYMSAAICDGIEDVLNRLPSADPEAAIVKVSKMVEEYKEKTGTDEIIIMPKKNGMKAWDENGVEYTMQPTCNNLATDTISRQAAIAEFSCCELTPDGGIDANYAIDFLKRLPSAQPDIKQAAKLLLDFIESCPGGDSYLTTPNGEELRTDWGYTMEGIQLIHDWAERRSDG